MTWSSSWPTRRGQALYVNLQMDQGFFCQRVKDVVLAKGVQLLKPLEIWRRRGVPTDCPTFIVEIRSWAEYKAHPLVTIDPAGQLLGLRENNGRRDLAALLWTVEKLAAET